MSVERRGPAVCKDSNNMEGKICVEDRTQTKSLIFSAIRFDREDQRIARGSSSLTSVRQSRTKPRKPCVTLFEAGTCRSAATRRSRICRGCSIPLSEAGSDITGDTIARLFIRLCALSTEILPFGPSGNTRSCVTISDGRHTGSPAYRVAILGCSRTGRWECGVAP